MKKLQNDTLQKFLENVITELKRTNEDRKIYDIKGLDIPFIVSSLWQSFNNNPDKYKEFISDLGKWSDYNAIIDVTVVLADIGNSEYLDVLYSDYDYRFEFSYDTRDYGYCECSPDMPDYREDKHCCGHGCDASFCQFDLYKVLHITNDTWQGDEHDYWDFEDEFYMNDKELADKKAEEDRLRKIEELKNQIETASKKLKELVGDKV